MKEQKGEVERKKKETQRQADENFGDSKMGKLRNLVWNLMEYPETSRAAQVSCIHFLFPAKSMLMVKVSPLEFSLLQIFAWASLGMVLVSTFTFILGTLPG